MANKPRNRLTSGVPCRLVPGEGKCVCWRDLHPLESQLASLHQIPACEHAGDPSALGPARTQKKGISARAAIKQSFSTPSARKRSLA